MATKRPPSIQEAVAKATMNMSTEVRGALWARMARRFNTKACPPVLVEKWTEAGNDKNAKNKAFETFLACGGEVGVMNALEVARKKITQIEDEIEEWLTEKEMAKVLDYDDKQITELKKRKVTEKKSRAHPDFPSEKNMTQYRCLVKSRLSNQVHKEREQSINWTAKLEGQVATNAIAVIEKMIASVQDKNVEKPNNPNAGCGSNWVWVHEIESVFIGN